MIKMWSSTLFTFTILAMICTESGAQLTQEWQINLPLKDLNPYTIKAIKVNRDILIAGNSYEDPTNITTFKIGKDGTVLWHFHYNGDLESYDHLGDITTDNYGNAIITGETYTRFVPEYDVLLEGSSSAIAIKLDSLGHLKWKNQYSFIDSSWTSGQIVVALNDSLTLQIVEQNNTDSTTVIFTYIDMMGNLTRERIVHQFVGWDIISYYLSDSVVFLNILRTQGLQEFRLIRLLDFDGNEINSYVLPKPHYFSDLVGLGDPEFYGILTLGNFGLIKMDSNGRHLWKYDLPSNLQPNVRADQVHKIEVDRDAIYLTGRYHSEQTRGDLLTSRLNTDGTLVWSDLYQGAGDDKFQGGYDLLLMNDYVVTAGSSENNGLIMIYDKNSGTVRQRKIQADQREIRKLIKVSESEFYSIGHDEEKIVITKYGVTTSYNMEDLEKPVRVFPTLVTSVVNISSPFEIERLRLYDSQGLFLHEVTTAENRIELNCQSLPPGVYFLQILTRKGIFIERVFRQ